MSLSWLQPRPNVGGVTEVRRLSSSSARSAGSVLLLCPEAGCQRAFVSEGELTRHSLENHEDRRNYCTVSGCSKRFKSCHNLAQHIRVTHSKIHACPVQGCTVSPGGDAQQCQHFMDAHDRSVLYHCQMSGCQGTNTFTRHGEKLNKRTEIATTQMAKGMAEKILETLYDYKKGMKRLEFGIDEREEQLRFNTLYRIAFVSKERERRPEMGTSCETVDLESQPLQATVIPGRHLTSWFDGYEIGDPSTRRMMSKPFQIRSAARRRNLVMQHAPMQHPIVEPQPRVFKASLVAGACTKKPGMPNSSNANIKFELKEESKVQLVRDWLITDEELLSAL